jgi:hypothetical protein
MVFFASLRLREERSAEAASRLRDHALLPLICPTRQVVSGNPQFIIQ